MARADAGLTISELARRAGVSRDTISNAERGEHSLQASTLHKVARALGKAPSELLAEEERLTPKVESRSSLEPSFNDVLEEERREDVFDIALSAARRQVEKDRKAVNRTLASEGIQQPAYFADYENSAITQLLQRPAAELAPALMEMAMRIARQEQVEQAAKATAEQPAEKAQSGSA